MSEGENVWRQRVQVGVCGPDHTDLLAACDSAWRRAWIEAQDRVRRTGCPVTMGPLRIEIAPVGTPRQRGVMSGVVIEMYGPMADSQEAASECFDENPECTG